MSADDYLNYLAETYSPDFIFTGFNHTFGANKSGNPQYLSLNSNKFGFKYICVEPVKYDNQVVSSSLIKQYLKSGDVYQAAKLLQNKFYIEGTVISGSKIGRTIGFPTANIIYPEEIVKLPYGVYSVSVIINNYSNKSYKGILNWGYKPTLNNTSEPIAEVHILEFNDDIYDKQIKVIFDKFIRNEIKFNNLEELKLQINKDKLACLEL
jgi:riboflavin kinase/FMN adenylyltransferase